MGVQLPLFPEAYTLTCTHCGEPFTSRTIVDLCDVCYDDWCDEQDWLDTWEAAQEEDRNEEW